MSSARIQNSEETIEGRVLKVGPVLVINTFVNEGTF